MTGRGREKGERERGTSEELLGKVQGVAKTEVLVVKDGADGAFLFGSVVVRETREELREMLPLGVRQDFSPCALTQH